MSNFTPSKKTAQDFNNGVEYIDGVDDIEGDAVHAESINSVIEGLLYTQGLAVNTPDVSEANNIGTVAVSIITYSDGTAQLKFSNLKGKQGVGISTIVSNGTDANGGNIYKITLEDGQTYNFVAPKGEKGDMGNGIAETTVTYATSTLGTTIPADSAWQSSIPTVDKGNYLWTRTVVTYTDGKSNASYSSAYQGMDGTGAVESVNGQTGAVTITPANIGAVNKSGDTMTGDLTLPNIKLTNLNTPNETKNVATSAGWFYIGKLRASSGGTYDSMSINGRVGGWQSMYGAHINATILGREGLRMIGTVHYASSFYGIGGEFEAYQQSDGSYNIYFHAKNEYEVVDLWAITMQGEISRAAQHSTTTPTGTKMSISNLMITLNNTYSSNNPPPAYLHRISLNGYGSLEIYSCSPTAFSMSSLSTFVYNLNGNSIGAVAQVPSTLTQQKLLPCLLTATSSGTLTLRVLDSSFSSVTALNITAITDNVTQVA